MYSSWPPDATPEPHTASTDRRVYICQLWGHPGHF